MNLVMPWFLPVAAIVASLGIRTARHLHTEKRRRGDLLLMLILTASPLLFWLIAQFTTQPVSYP